MVMMIEVQGPAARVIEPTNAPPLCALGVQPVAAMVKVVPAASWAATPLASPLTPVEMGSPVALVSVPELGVPSAPPWVTSVAAEGIVVPFTLVTAESVAEYAGFALAPPLTSACPEVPGLTPRIVLALAQTAVWY